MKMSLAPIRRVVTSHDAHGDAVIATDGSLPTVIELAAIPGTMFHEVWSTATTPVLIDNGSDPTIGPLCLPPPAHGTRIRFVDIPPDTEDFLKHGAARMKDAFSQVGDVHASTVRPDSPHPLMHRTETVDYGIVISGEITLVLDKGEANLKAGDVVIQRGTNHAWANRSGQPCRMLFMLVDGQFSDEVNASKAGS
ncbi:cupin domain-containing protein [Bradyrhizobium guangdongense]|nr:cupin domain-containing protein [Bradyrhizobium guangdongense]